MAGSCLEPRRLAERAREENFPVALRVLPRRHRAALQAIYAYARYVDDIGDATGVPVARRAEALDAVAADVAALAAGRPVRLEVVAGLEPLLAAVASPERAAAPLLALLDANRVDLSWTRCADWSALRGYCALSADPVGRLVLLHFGAASPERVAASDQICTALQVLEHCQDVAEDWQTRGRVYLPEDLLREHGVAGAHLDAPATAPELRRVIGELVARSRSLLAPGEELVGSLHGAARLAVAGFVAGGRATADALARADFDVLARTVRPARRDVVRHAARLLRGAGR